MTTRAILVDDHAMMREGLRLILQRAPDVEIVGEAANGRDAVALVKQLTPDVVIMDISMADLNGIEATRQIQAVTPAVKVIGLSAYTDTRSVLGMLQAGAKGFVHKATAGDELVQAIHAVMNDRHHLSADITGVIVDQYVGPYSPPQPTAATLASREREVLQLVAEGKSSKEVASRLNISPQTVEVHRRHIMAKLDLHSTAQLTKFAVREGLTPLSPD